MTTTQPTHESKTMTKKEAIARHKEVRIQLTLAFIGGRRPNNAEMVEVEKLREEEAELHSLIAYRL
jgi:hypothetical protein